MCWGVFMVGEAEGISLDAGVLGVFDWSGREEAVRSASLDTIRGVLAEAANETSAGGNVALHQALLLIADACSMQLHPNNVSQPYGPLWVLSDRRSTIPSDFTVEHLDFFVRALDFIRWELVCTYGGCALAFP